MSPPPDSGDTPKAALSVTRAAPGVRIKVATWNMANLSEKKLAKPEVAALLARLVRQYDVIAAQELQDKTHDPGTTFLAELNKIPGDRFDFRQSGNSGTTATGDQTERYAVYFNTSKIEAMDEGALYPDPGDVFVREPFAVQLRVKDAGVSFVVVTIHTAPAAAPKEIAGLRAASDWAAARYSGELGVIILGDYNGGKRYTKPEQIDALMARELPYLWIVPNGVATTLARLEPEAHDRIVVTGDLAKAYTQKWGIDNTQFSETKYSDHYPVWAEFLFSHRN